MMIALGIATIAIVGVYGLFKGVYTVYNAHLAKSDANDTLNDVMRRMRDAALAADSKLYPVTGGPVPGTAYTETVASDGVTHCTSSAAAPCPGLRLFRQKNVGGTPTSVPFSIYTSCDPAPAGAGVNYAGVAGFSSCTTNAGKGGVCPVGRRPMIHMDDNGQVRTFPKYNGRGAGPGGLAQSALAGSLCFIEMQGLNVNSDMQLQATVAMFLPQNGNAPSANGGAGTYVPNIIAHDVVLPMTRGGNSVQMQ